MLVYGPAAQACNQYYRESGVKILWMGVLCTLLSACGFKGDLYLPKENDEQTFGAVQTGFGIDKRPNQVSPTMQNNPQPF